MESKGKAFRHLLRDEPYLFTGGVYSPLDAQIAESAGMKSIYLSGYSVAIAYGGKRVATVFATMNMSGNIGAGIFPFIVGGLVTLTGNWNLALLVFAGMFAASGVCWSFLKPTGTLFDDEVALKNDDPP